MKERSKKPLYLPVSLIAVTVIAALIVNLFIMTKVNSDQIEELGRMDGRNVLYGGGFI